MPDVELRLGSVFPEMSVETGDLGVVHADFVSQEHAVEVDSGAESVNGHQGVAIVVSDRYSPEHHPVEGDD